MRILPFLALAFVVPALLRADEPPKLSQWNGFDRLDFQVAARPALLVKPRTPAPGLPWIWRTEFFGHEPQADLALLAAGWHVAYLQVSDMYGAPPAIALMAQFHDALVRDYGLSLRAVLEGFSRGGLYAVNFAAAHPAHTAALYLDAPVLDIRSWPGGKGASPGDKRCWQQALDLYGLTEETALTFKGNPLDQLTPLAEARIPILVVCGDADKAVPMAENTTLLEQRYRALGGTITVIAKPGVDHHPHSLKDPQPIVDFLLKNALAK